MFQYVGGELLTPPCASFSDCREYVSTAETSSLALCVGTTSAQDVSYTNEPISHEARLVDRLVATISPPKLASNAEDPGRITTADPQAHIIHLSYTTSYDQVSLEPPELVTTVMPYRTVKASHGKCPHSASPPVLVATAPPARN